MTDTPQQNPLGAVLKQARDLLGLSVRGAAEKASISSTYLSQLEGGAVKEPSPRVLHNLARVYEISYAELQRTGSGNCGAGAFGEGQRSPYAPPTD